MRYRLYSDIHLEFNAWNIPEVQENVIIMAGDIAVGAQELIKFFNSYLSYYPNKHIIFVLGNHELYRQDKEEVTAILDVGFHRNFHFLNNSYTTINGQRFIGATMWTDYNRGDRNIMLLAQHSLNDHRLIRTSNGLFSTAMAYAEHQKTITFFEENLQKDDIVVTHHAPSLLSCEEQYKGDKLNYAFASDLSDLIDRKQPKVWCHGHMHNHSDYMLYNTRIIANPRGYSRRESNFLTFEDFTFES